MKVFVTSFKSLIWQNLYYLIYRNVPDSVLSHMHFQILQIQNISIGFRDMSDSVNIVNTGSDSPADSPSGGTEK